MMDFVDKFGDVELTVGEGGANMWGALNAAVEDMLETGAPDLSDLGPDATRDHKSSLRPYRFDLIDPRALLHLARIMHEGLSTHQPEGWRDIPVQDHINHALIHLYAHLSGDTTNDHLGHAFARCMMALALHIRKEPV